MTAGRGAPRGRGAPQGPELGSYRGPRVDGVTQGALADWTACRERGRLYFSGVRREGESRALRYGTAFHGMLEAHYRSERVALSDPAAFEPEAWLDAWAEREIGRGRDPQEVELDAGALSATFARYVERYAKADAGRAWVELESAFDVRWQGFRLRGRCDGVWRDPNGTAWIFETKTKSQIPEDALNDALGFDFQSLFYVTAKAAELGEPVRGVLYNVIRTPGYRSKLTAEGMREKVWDDVGRDPSHWLKRWEIVYPQEVQARFQAELLRKLCELERWCRGGAPHYKTEAACIGKWHCGYLPACGAGGRLGAGFVTGAPLFEELED